MADLILYSSLDLNGKQVKNFAPEVLSSPPSPFPGRTYYDSTLGLVGIYDDVAEEWKYSGADIVLDASDIPSLDASKITTGTFDIARLPVGAVSKLAIVADETARFALTTAEVQNGDSVKQTDTDVIYYVVDDANLDSSTGYEVYTAETDWSLISNKPQNVIDIAAITPTDNDVIQVKSGAFVSRTPAQLLVDLAPTTNDVTESTDKNYVSDAELEFLGEASPLGVPYADDFLSTDFVTSGSDKVLTIDAATHGLGATADLEVSVRTSAGEDASFGVVRGYNANGDVTVTVDSGLEFNGRYIIKRLA